MRFGMEIEYKHYNLINFEVMLTYKHSGVQAQAATNFPYGLHPSEVRIYIFVYVLQCSRLELGCRSHGKIRHKWLGFWT